VHGQALAIFAGGSLCPGRHAFAGLILRSPVLKNLVADRVAQIVGGAKRFDFVFLIADVVPRPPRPGLAPQAAVSEMQLLIEGDLIRHPSRLQTAARLARIQSPITTQPSGPPN
jgi:hypothetical protein